MVIDSFALIALLLGEVETPSFLAAIAASPRRLVSAASYVEAAIVIVRRSGPRAREELDQLRADLGVDIVQFNRTQADLAITAYMQYGKGRGHAAQLNLGDCLTYALVKDSGEPVLFKGNDFAQTDLIPVIVS